MKELLDAGFLHGDCLTITGKTVAENLKDTPKLSELGEQVKKKRHFLRTCRVFYSALLFMNFRLSSIRYQIPSPSLVIT